MCSSVESRRQSAASSLPCGSNECYLFNNKGSLSHARTLFFRTTRPMMVINMLLSGLRRSQATMSDCLARVGNSLPTAVPWRRLVWCSTVPFCHDSISRVTWPTETQSGSYDSLHYIVSTSKKQTLSRTVTQEIGNWSQVLHMFLAADVCSVDLPRTRETSTPSHIARCPCLQPRTYTYQSQLSI